MGQKIFQGFKKKNAKETPHPEASYSRSAVLLK